MSRHLRTLRESGLVAQTHPEFDARVRVYALRQGPMDELRDWLAAAEALWSDQVAAFQAHLEGSPQAAQASAGRGEGE